VTGYETLDAALRAHPGTVFITVRRLGTGASMRIAKPGVPKPVDLLGVDVAGPDRGTLLRAVAEVYDRLDGGAE
jgi:hypothetical protein